MEDIVTIFIVVVCMFVVVYVIVVVYNLLLFFQIIMKDKQIQPIKNIKFSGLILYANLSFKEHTRSIVY